MIEVSGVFFDGKTSRQYPAKLRVYENGMVKLETQEKQATYDVQQLNISQRLGNTQRNIFLVDGEKFATHDNEAIDRICKTYAVNNQSGWLHKLEHAWKWVFVSMFICVIVIWSSIEFLLPQAAKWAAQSVPYEIEVEMGENGLKTLDEWFFSKSKLALQTQHSIRQDFDLILAGLENAHEYRLLFRDSHKMGANALALPGGIIIVTDGLVELAKNREQLIAVLVHEVGHIHNQHGLRALFQNSMTAILMAGLLGDLTSISSLSVTLPTLLVESRYSREFESEADQYAVDYLIKENIPVEHFVDILSLLSHQHDLDMAFDYLSSHPAMKKRIDAIQSNPGI